MGFGVPRVVVYYQFALNLRQVQLVLLKSLQKGKRFDPTVVNERIIRPQFVGLLESVQRALVLTFSEKLITDRFVVVGELLFQGISFVCRVTLLHPEACSDQTDQGGYDCCKLA